jgi:DNA-binding PadR family transcriptional regulator
MRDGFVTRRTVAQPDRPDKLIYRLTKAGRQELESWLEHPFVRQSGYRDDFFLKLFAASRLGPGRLRSVLRTQR